MIIQWINPILSWLGIGLVPFLLLSILIVLIINLIRG